jgi:hypothetical protein
LNNREILTLLRAAPFFALKGQGKISEQCTSQVSSAPDKVHSSARTEHDDTDYLNMGRPVHSESGQQENYFSFVIGAGFGFKGFPPGSLRLIFRTRSPSFRHLLLFQKEATATTLDAAFFDQQQVTGASHLQLLPVLLPGRSGTRWRLRWRC